jgi:itaconate CoA-transferase
VVNAVFGAHSSDEMTQRLERAQTAFGQVSSVDDLIAHPQLRTVAMNVNGNTAHIPAPPYRVEWQAAVFPPAPTLNAQGDALRREFALGVENKARAS